MRGLVELCIRRPVFATMLVLTPVVVGLASYVRLPIDRFPAVDLPSVSVRTLVPGASAEEVESLVSQRLEEAVNTVEGIEQLRSISSAGSSLVAVTFRLERDIEAAAQDVRERVATALRDLPPEAEPPIVSKFDNDQTPVLTLALSGPRARVELTELADKLVKPLLERSSGVGEVALVGGAPRAINVWVDAGALAAYGLSITDVRATLARENAETPGGNLTGPGRESVLRTLGRIEHPRGFGELVVAERGGVPIRVRDVARVEDGTKEARSAARLDGTPCVSLEVRRQSGSNTLEVIEGVKAALATARADLPADVRLEVVRDQSRYIVAALEEIRLHLVLGSLLASLVVWLFMRSWPSTWIAALAIPSSLVACFGLMEALGFTLNSVTMLALVLMVGVVIDDAIVVLENIFRLREERGLDGFAAAREGTAEIALAVTATTLSLAVIFVPVSFLSSISGRFLYQFGLTSAAAVMVSLLVSFTLTPSLAARFLGRAALPHAPEERTRGGLYGRFERAYVGALALALRFRWAVVLLAAGIVALSGPIYRSVKQEYTPSDVDEGEFEVNVNGPEGTSFAAMDAVLREVESEVRALSGVRTVLSSVGGSFLGQVNQGSLYVRIAPHAERRFSLARFARALLDGEPGAALRGNYTQRDVMNAVRTRLARFKDLRCSVRNAPSFNIGGGNWEIDFSILGPDLPSLARYGEDLRQRSKALGGILDADTTLKLDRPELAVRLEREHAADRGVAAAELAGALRLMVGGEERVTRYRDRALGEDYDVSLRLAPEDRTRAERVAELTLAGRDGPVRLSDLVRFEEQRGASRIDRLDRARVVSLRTNVAPGYGQADRLAALRGAVAEMGLPEGYTTRVSGRGRELERTFEEFLWAFLLSFVLMYVILAAQFESFVHPLTILVSLPLAVPFALLSLAVTGTTLNLFSALGILVLFGVVKKNSILQIDHTNQLRARGLERRAAILEANRDRLRPILMTTLTLVVGMLPLLVGTGPGAEERHAVAVIVIGGQSLSLFLTLLVTPVVYELFDDLGARLRRRAA